MAGARIRDLGVAVGIALNPETPLSTITQCLPHVDMALVMSVEAGFGGQQFNPIALEKLQGESQNDPVPIFLLQIDGGIDPSTIHSARQAGC